MLNTKTKTYLFFKRLLDFFFSFFAILFLCGTLILPIILIVQFFDTNGKPIFTQKRVGKNNKIFKMIKIRTLKSDIPENIPSENILDLTEACTKNGLFLRQLRLDEITQIFNVFVGQMSFVGPRPILYNNEELHLLRNNYNIYLIRPGITGYAQAYADHVLSNAEKVKMDCEYLANLSFKFDCKIFFHTLRIVFQRKRR